MLDKGIALVTGAFGGLGTAIVDRLVSEGASVLATDRRAEDAEIWLAGFSAKARRLITTQVLDITKEEQIQALRESLDARGEHVAYLVNNAGVTGAGAPWV
ncbi:MAG: SDR family NAD(P)-dependent oxidoreductase, partial [Gammaproteobacteria bacterium]